MLTASFNSRMFAWEPFISWHFHSQLLSHLVYDIKLRRSIAFIETVWKDVGACNQNKHAYFLWFSSLQVLWWYVLINVTLISLVLGIWLLELFSFLLFEPRFFQFPFRHPSFPSIPPSRKTLEKFRRFHLWIQFYFSCRWRIRNFSINLLLATRAIVVSRFSRDHVVVIAGCPCLCTCVCFSVCKNYIWVYAHTLFCFNRVYEMSTYLTFLWDFTSLSDKHISLNKS